MMRGYGLDYGYGYGGMMGGWLGPLAMFFIAVLIIVGVVVLVMWISRSAGHGAPPAPGGRLSSAGHDEAVAIAKRRFANGEITKEQYDEMMRALAG